MADIYFENETFNQVDFTENHKDKAQYEDCFFQNCNFLGTDLSEVNFINCEFTECDLSNAKIQKTSFQDVEMKNSKLLGLAFEECNQFGFAIKFSNCILNHSSFYQLKLGWSSFIDCQLEGVDFTQSNLKNVKMTSCNLLNAIFDNTILEGADLRNSRNYSIDPEANYLSRAKFSLPDIIGLLDRYDLDIEL